MLPQEPEHALLVALGEDPVDVFMLGPGHEPELLGLACSVEHRLGFGGLGLAVEFSGEQEDRTTQLGHSLDGPNGIGGDAEAQPALDQQQFRWDVR